MNGTDVLVTPAVTFPLTIENRFDTEPNSALLSAP
jgi:hypothetical protein